MEKVQVIRGMRDLLPEDTSWWRRMEAKMCEVLERYGYGEIRTPLLEQAALFSRSIGEETDIVEKEMYTFPDRDGALVTLRPEGTASAVRCYVEQSRWNKEPLSRWYYLGPMFRHERPQKGRYRQFYQVGVELIGAAEPAADVELIDVMMEMSRAIGLTGASLKLNSLGCSACRPGYRAALKGYLENQIQALCENCQRRTASNPLRVLDCKVEGCIRVSEQAPKMLDALCPDCAAHFEKVRGGLEVLGIPSQINHRLMRGLDYYTRTTFELQSESLGAQNAVAGGGRYDGLIEMLGGPKTPAVGFAAGLDRILLSLMETQKAPENPCEVFVVTTGEETWKASLTLLQRLRRKGFCVGSDVRWGSMKSQMKRAAKLGSKLALLLGEEELSQNAVTLRDMALPGESDGKQVRVPLQNIEEEVARRLVPIKNPQGF
jgi:histidyl-tRNA synthetase